MDFFSLLLLGFVFGIKHAFDADHLAAVAVLTRLEVTKKHALLRGIAWGLGHTSVLLAIGIFVLLLKINIPHEFSMVFEFVIAALLIMTGAIAVLRFFKSRRVVRNHIVIHSHPPLGLHAHRPSFFIGVLHGLAGGAALLVGVVSIMESAFLGLLYIIIFGLGSIVGMSIVSLAFHDAARFAKNYFNLAAGAVSATSGIIIVLSNIYR